LVSAALVEKIEPLRALWGSNEAVRVLVVMPSIEINQGPRKMELSNRNEAKVKD
jgi:hypothetical protein